MLMADFNRDPGDMPARRQNRLITTGEVTHLYSYTELDYAYSSSQNNNTVVAERSGSGGVRPHRHPVPDGDRLSARRDPPP